VVARPGRRSETQAREILYLKDTLNSLNAETNRQPLANELPKTPMRDYFLSPPEAVAYGLIIVSWNDEDSSRCRTGEASPGLNSTRCIERSTFPRAFAAAFPFASEPRLMAQVRRLSECSSAAVPEQVRKLIAGPGLHLHECIDLCNDLDEELVKVQRRTTPTLRNKTARKSRAEKNRQTSSHPGHDSQALQIKSFSRCLRWWARRKAKESALRGCLPTTTRRWPGKGEAMARSIATATRCTRSNILLNRPHRLRQDPLPGPRPCRTA